MCASSADSAIVPQVRVDAEQMRRVIINLVDNAIEATDRHGTVTWRPRTILEQPGAHHRGGRWPGDSGREREKLFLPYYSTKGRGSGLGLAIVRRIIAEHGGSIEVAATNREVLGLRLSFRLTQVRRSAEAAGRKQNAETPPAARPRNLQSEASMA